jgi:hypothetical protein
LTIPGDKAFLADKDPIGLDPIGPGTIACRVMSRFSQMVTCSPAPAQRPRQRKGMPPGSGRGTVAIKVIKNS